jgi:hypothetical protein
MTAMKKHDRGAGTFFEIFGSDAVNVDVFLAGHCADLFFS